MVDISLRPATRVDFLFLWELHRSTLRPYVDQTWGWDEAWQADYFQAHFDPSRLQIVEVDGRPIGMISIESREELIFLASIEIAPEYQNLGIGRRLLQDLLTKTAAKGLPVELSVLRVNPARRLYERLGFQVCAENETHYRMRWEEK